jgi:hypothetical protein
MAKPQRERIAPAGRRGGWLTLCDTFQTPPARGPGPLWVMEKDLRPARSRRDVVAEMDAGGAGPIDFCHEILDNQVDTVPATWSWLPTIGHRTSG